MVVIIIPSPIVAAVAAVVTAIAAPVVMVVTAAAPSAPPMTAHVTGHAEGLLVELLFGSPIGPLGLALGSLQGLAGDVVKERLLLVVGGFGVDFFGGDFGCCCCGRRFFASDFAFLQLLLVLGLFTAVVLQRGLLELLQQTGELVVGLLEVVFRVEFQSLLFAGLLRSTGHEIAAVLLLVLVLLLVTLINTSSAASATASEAAATAAPLAAGHSTPAGALPIAMEADRVDPLADHGPGLLLLVLVVTPAGRGAPGGGG